MSYPGQENEQRTRIPSRKEQREAAKSERRLRRFFARLFMTSTGSRREEYHDLAVKNDVSSRRRLWKLRSH